MCGPTLTLQAFSLWQVTKQCSLLSRHLVFAKRWEVWLPSYLVHTQTSSRPYRTSFWVALGWPIGNSLESNRTRDLRAWSCIANNLD